MARSNLWLEADAVAQSIPYLLTRERKKAVISKLLETLLVALAFGGC
jgi:hypothetical protein